MDAKTTALRDSIPDPKQITKRGVWLVFPLVDSERACLARFICRFGREPRYCLEEQKWRWLGPVEE